MQLPAHLAADADMDWHAHRLWHDQPRKDVGSNDQVMRLAFGEIEKAAGESGLSLVVSPPHGKLDGSTLGRYQIFPA